MTGMTWLGLNALQTDSSIFKFVYSPVFNTSDTHQHFTIEIKFKIATTMLNWVMPPVGQQVALGNGESLYGLTFWNESRHSIFRHGAVRQEGYIMLPISTSRRVIRCNALSIIIQTGPSHRLSIASKVLIRVTDESHRDSRYGHRELHKPCI